MQAYYMDQIYVTLVASCRFVLLRDSDTFLSFLLWCPITGRTLGEIGIIQQTCIYLWWGARIKCHPLLSLPWIIWIFWLTSLRYLLLKENFDMLRALVQTRVLVVHIDIQTIFLIFPPSYALMHVLILISSYFGNFLEFLLSLRSSTKSCWKCFV